MQSFIGSKTHQRWLWQAIDHYTGEVLAYVIGRRLDQVFLKLKGMLKPFGIENFYTDKLKTYESDIY